MNNPPKDNAHIWNDLPFEERKRLMPYMMEAQLLHIHQCKHKAIQAHKKHMRELDDWMNNIKRELDMPRDGSK